MLKWIKKLFGYETEPPVGVNVNTLIHLDLIAKARKEDRLIVKKTKPINTNYASSKLTSSSSSTRQYDSTPDNTLLNTAIAYSIINNDPSPTPSYNSPACDSSSSYSSHDSSSSYSSCDSGGGFDSGSSSGGFD